MNFSSKSVTIGALVISVVAGGTILRSYVHAHGRLSTRAALQELHQPHDDERTRQALRSIQQQGARVLPQTLQFYKEATTAEQRAYAVGLLLSLPATTETVQAMIDLVVHEQNFAFKERFAHYLEQASEQHLGSDGQAWQDWWDKDGKNRKTFSRPYGTMPANGGALDGEK